MILVAASSLGKLPLVLIARLRTLLTLSMVLVVYMTRLISGA